MLVFALMQALVLVFELVFVVVYVGDWDNIVLVPNVDKLEVITNEFKVA